MTAQQILTARQTSPAEHFTVADAELMSVLVALDPLGDRALSYVDVGAREFSMDIHDIGWSTGERCLVDLARALWSGGAGDFDFAYFVIALGSEFVQAGLDAIAVRLGREISSRGAAALARAVEAAAERILADLPGGDR